MHYIKVTSRPKVDRLPDLFDFLENKVPVAVAGVGDDGIHKVLIHPLTLKQLMSFTMKHILKHYNIQMAKGFKNLFQYSNDVYIFESGLKKHNIQYIIVEE